MISKLLASYLSYFALAIVGVSIAGLLSGRVPEKFRNGLYIPLMLAIVLLVYIVVRPKQEEIPPEPVVGEFTVPAYQSKGVPYVNYMSFPIEVDFLATGEWSTEKISRSRSGPEGLTDSKKTDGRYRLPDSYQGALIAKYMESGNYIYIGAAKSLTLQAKEQILFYINDFKPENAYSDNYGEIKIHWTCHNCRMRVRN